MEFDQIIQDRRSIRKFISKEVEEEKVVALLESARLCQSAKNRQPWKFMLLTGKDKDEVADIMLSLFEKNHVELTGYANSSKNSAHIIQQAPLLVLAFIERDENWIHSDLLSMGAAIEHLCLKAVDLDLGAVWIADTVYTRDEISAAMGYANLQLISGIAIGYPDEHPNPRPRKEIEDILLKKQSLLK